MNATSSTLLVIVLVLLFGPGLIEFARAIRFALAARHWYRIGPPREDEP